MTGADAVLRCLEAEGVTVMFGLPGGAILPLYDAMARGTSVRHVLARHEQGAGQRGGGGRLVEPEVEHQRRGEQHRARVDDAGAGERVAAVG